MDAQAIHANLVNMAGELRVHGLDDMADTLEVVISSLEEMINIYSTDEEK